MLNRFCGCTHNVVCLLCMRFSGTPLLFVLGTQVKKPGAATMDASVWGTVYSRLHHNTHTLQAKEPVCTTISLKGMCLQA